GSMHFTWTWNVKDVLHQEVTTVPELKAELLRQSGDELYRIDVTVSGSGTCERTTCVKVLVEGTCPHIRELNYTFCELSETEAHLVFHVQLREQPAPLTEPDTYIWEWGDGSPSLITHTPHASHVFVRNPEEALPYPVRVTAKGTQCGCETSAEVLAELPGTCPLVTAIRPVYGAQTDDSQEVTLIASTRGGTPASYRWELGDGSKAQDTKVPHIAHAFKRTQAAYVVRLIITGEADGRRGDSCRHERELFLEIPLREKEAVS
ncbi:MAG: PKD domain-containing protein, partial [Bacteroidetes bacterium]